MAGEPMVLLVIEQIHLVYSTFCVFGYLQLALILSGLWFCCLFTAEIRLNLLRLCLLFVWCNTSRLIVETNVSIPLNANIVANAGTIISCQLAILLRLGLNFVCFGVDSTPTCSFWNYIFIICVLASP